MHVRRIILCFAAAFLWATYSPDMASGQSSELMEAYNSYKNLVYGATRAGVMT